MDKLVTVYTRTDATLEQTTQAQGCIVKVQEQGFQVATCYLTEVTCATTELRVKVPGVYA